jgi:hypothetical protein
MIKNDFVYELAKNGKIYVCYNIRVFNKDELCNYE